MFSTAVRVMRTRLTSYLASGGVILAGTALLVAFASLAETGINSEERGADTLRLLPAILGSWTAAIVVFAIVMTMSLTIRYREREYALLRSIGATPSQTRRIVVTQAMLVALPMIALALPAGIGIGHLVLTQLYDTDLVSPVIELRTGWFTIAVGLATGLLTTLLAATLAGRRTSAIAPVRALAGAHESVAVPTRMTWGRRIMAMAFIFVGLNSGGSTFLMDDAITQVAMAGPACVFTGIGLAMLAPAAARLIGRLAEGPFGATVRLAGRGVAGRAGTAIAPLVLLVGIATGTLYLQSTDDATQQGPRDTSAGHLATVNYMVVAMIIAFATITVLATLIAATRERRREFGLLRVTAATPRQVLTMVCAEAVLTALAGIVLGTLAAAATVVPYAIVKTDSPIPSGSPWAYLAIVAGTILIALLSTLVPAVRTLRARPITTLTQ